MTGVRTQEDLDVFEYLMMNIEYLMSLIRGEGPQQRHPHYTLHFKINP